MQIERQAGALVIRAPAKVNLFLEVLAKRPDGYHDIETLMVAVNIFDTLKFREDSSGDIRLTCNRPELSTGPDNLVVRAAALLKLGEHWHLQTIKFEKQISKIELSYCIKYS